jgi:PHS family inorganic phosphate transporter-like MFS transporter
VFYANSLFHADVTSALGSGTLMLDARNTLIIVLIMLPGYWVAIAALDKLGRKNMQMLGFAMMTGLFLLCGLFYQELKDISWLFVLVYGLTFFFSNFGPNTTTYIVPGEIYPTRLKATCHGISAASGKAGAALGTFVFPFLNPDDPAGLRHAMLICSSTAVLGFVATVFLTPRYQALDLQPNEEDIAQGRSVHFVPLRMCGGGHTGDKPLLETDQLGPAVGHGDSAALA